MFIISRRLIHNIMAAATNQAQKMEPAIDRNKIAHGGSEEFASDRSEDREYERAVSEAFDQITSPSGQYSPVGADFSRGRLDLLVKSHCVDRISIGGNGQQYDLMDTFEPMTETDEDGNERDLGGQSRVYIGYGQVPDSTTPHGYKIVEYLAIAGYAGDPNTFMDSGDTQAEIDMKTKGLDRKIVAQVYDVSFIQIDGNKVIPVTIMETVHGKSLFEYIDENELPKSAQLELFKRYVENIGAVHDAGYVHRDIKPNNVIIENDGNPRIIDFGISAKLGKPPKNSSVSGTPAYMSPEHMENKVDQRMDIYSLGCVLYELLMDKTPYNHVIQKHKLREKKSDDISPEQLRYQFAKNLYSAMINEDHEHKRSTRTLDKRYRLSEELAFIVDRCISRKPEDRFQNCGALANALEKVIEYQKDLEAVYSAVDEAMKKSDLPGGIQTRPADDVEQTEDYFQLRTLVEDIMAQADLNDAEQRTTTTYSRPKTLHTAQELSEDLGRKGRTKIFAKVSNISNTK